jgi:hypothetical protein
MPPIAIDHFSLLISGEFFKVLFDFCYKYKLDWLKRGYTTPLLDLIIYRNVRSLVGGKIRLMLSGNRLSAGSSVADPGCLYPGFDFFPSRIRIKEF